MVKSCGTTGQFYWPTQKLNRILIGQLFLISEHKTKNEIGWNMYMDVFASKLFYTKEGNMGFVRDTTNRGSMRKRIPCTKKNLSFLGSVNTDEYRISPSQLVSFLFFSIYFIILFQFISIRLVRFVPFRFVSWILYAI